MGRGRGRGGREGRGAKVLGEPKFSYTVVQKRQDN